MKKIIFISIVFLSLQLFAQDPFGAPQLILGVGSTNGIVVFDYDNDGFMDVFVANGNNSAPANYNFLYLNNGDNTFTKQTTSGDIIDDEFISAAPTAGDYDNDGDEDLFISNVFTTSFSVNRNHLHSNNGDGTFTEASFESNHARYGGTSAWADFDEDGLLDVFISNAALQGGGANNALYQNNGGSFSYLSSNALSGSSSARAGCSWADYDNDGDMDLVIAAGGAGQKSSVWVNNNGSFTETVLVASGSTTESASWGDYDNDGDLDLLLTNSGDTDTSPETNFLYQNTAGALALVSNGNLTTHLDLSTGSAWGDYDNDGDLDLIIANNGNNTDGHHAKLYKNVDGVLSENTSSSNIINNANFGNTVIFFDYDNDGDLDIVFGRDGDNQLYANNAITSGGSMSTVGFASIKCVGNLSTTNKSALGSIVTLTASIDGSSETQIRDISSQTGLGSQNDIRAHFGLKNAANIASVTVDWLGGTSQTYNDLPINKQYVFNEGALSVSATVMPAQSFFYLFGNTGGSVEFTTADSDGGSLTMLRTDSDPGGSFSGNSATNPGSTSITANAVFSDKFWTVTPTDLTGFTSTVYFDASGLTGSPNLDDVVLMKRTNSGSDWVALNTNRIGNTLYSTGISSFSEFGIGYQESGVLAEIKIFIEGAYDTDLNEMTTTLNSTDIPLTSPYTEDARTVGSIPADVVDWILVELRTTFDGTALTSKSAFLHKDGRIVADDGTTGQIELDAPAGNYHIVIKHRNHINIMSSEPTIPLNSSTTTLYDFTTGSDKYYGTDGAKQIDN